MPPPAAATGAAAAAAARRSTLSGVVPPKDPLDSSFFTSQGPSSTRAPLAPHATGNALFYPQQQHQQHASSSSSSSSQNTSIDLLSGGGENEGPGGVGMGSIKGLSGRGVGIGSKGMAPPIPEDATTEGECAQQ